MPEWLPLVVTVNLAVLGAMGRIIWGLLNRRIESLLDQIGRNTQSGMRKTTHDAYNLGLANKGELAGIEDRIARVENYLNGKLRDSR